MSANRHLSGWAPAPREAQECLPWREGQPKNQAYVYPCSERPWLAIYHHRAWYECQATQRYHHPDGRYSYLVLIDLGDTNSYGCGHFWYDDETVIKIG
jgi:hypothetical protein